MQVAKPKLRSVTRKRRRAALWDGIKTVAGVIGVIIAAGLFIWFCTGVIHWFASNSTDANWEREQKQQEVAATKAAQEHYTQSRQAGAEWAANYDADHNACDARVGTEALKVEGWDQKAWLEGCTERANEG